MKKNYDKTRHFNRKWEREYYVIKYNAGLARCLICFHQFTVNKSFTIKTHYNRHHAEYGDVPVNSLARREILNNLKVQFIDMIRFNDSPTNEFIVGRPSNEEEVVNQQMSNDLRQDTEGISMSKDIFVDKTDSHISMPTNMELLANQREIMKSIAMLNTKFDKLMDAFEKNQLQQHQIVPVLTTPTISIPSTSAKPTILPAAIPPPSTIVSTYAGPATFAIPFASDIPSKSTIVQTETTFKFPIKTIDQLTKIEQKLINENYFNECLNYLNYSCQYGKGPNIEYVVLDEMFDKELLPQYTWTGFSPLHAKKCFKDLYSVIRLFAHVIQSIDQSYTENVAKVFLKIILKNAKSRLLSANLRKSSKRHRSKKQDHLGNDYSGAVTLLEQLQNADGAGVKVADFIDDNDLLNAIKMEPESDGELNGNCHNHIEKGRSTYLNSIQYENSIQNEVEPQIKNEMPIEIIDFQVESNEQQNNNEYSMQHSEKIENEFECHLCGKQFRFKRNIYSHLMDHRNGKRYKCAICSMAFCRKYNRDSHSQIHTGEKHYQCNICLKTFRQKSILTRHLRRLHTKVGARR